MITRATTPIHVFTFEEDIATNFDYVLITYAQSGVIVLEKDLTECTIEEKDLIVHLTQEDTKKFNASVDVEIQVRVLTKSSNALASQIFNLSVNRVLDDKILSMGEE